VRGGTVDEDALALAESAHALVESDTRRAAALAERAVEVARASRDPEAEVAALHALGFARHELGDPRAITTLRAAVRIGQRSGLVRRAALARRPLAIYLAYAGAVRLAIREIGGVRGAGRDRPCARGGVSDCCVSSGREETVPSANRASARGAAAIW